MTVEVAQAGLEPVILRFEHKELMGLMPCQRVSDPQLERHVEARDAKRS
jgi:hypothetical protein